MLQMPYQLRRAMHKRMGTRMDQTSRLSSWMRLCHAASLLGEAPNPFPTLLVEEWLAWPFVDQMAHLIEAWQNVPADRKYCRERRRLIKRLINGEKITPGQQRGLNSLHALGLVNEYGLSSLGEGLLRGTRQDEWSGIKPMPWVLSGEILQVPYPPDWRLLWDLEKYLDPLAPGVYRLDGNALRKAAQQAASTADIDMGAILAAGMGEALPAGLSAQMAGQPTIRVIPGPVLEVSSPEELVKLRQSTALRRDLEGLLSPRHVALDTWQAPGVMQKLYRREILSQKDILDWQASRALPGKPAVALTQAERAYLLSLMLLAGVLQNVIAAPPGLLERISQGLDDVVCAAAARRAGARNSARFW